MSFINAPRYQCTGGRSLEYLPVAISKRGGTWLGLSKNGRFAAVTNFRDLHRNGAPTESLRSRGDLVTKFLCASENVHDWTDSLAETCLEYGPFNLVVYDGQDMVYVNNQGDPKANFNLWRVCTKQPSAG